MVSNKLNFKAVAGAALNNAESVCSHWAPDGKRQGHEWVAINPTRADSSARSFSINLNTGVWSDFATDDKGRRFNRLGGVPRTNRAGRSVQAVGRVPRYGCQRHNRTSTSEAKTEKTGL